MPRISHVVGTKTYWFADLRDLLAKAEQLARQAAVGEQVFAHHRGGEYGARSWIEPLAEHAFELQHVRMRDVPGRDDPGAWTQGAYDLRAQTVEHAMMVGGCYETPYEVFDRKDAMVVHLEFIAFERAAQMLFEGDVLASPGRCRQLREATERAQHFVGARPGGGDFVRERLDRTQVGIDDRRADVGNDVVGAVGIARLRLHLVDGIGCGEVYEVSLRMFMDREYLQKPLQVNAFNDSDWRLLHP